MSSESTVIVMSPTQPAPALSTRVTAVAVEHSNAEPVKDDWALACALLKEDVLVRVAEAMTAQGYAGDVRPPLLGYVAMTSRLLRDR